MSLRQSMYTGLAQPEVKINGSSSENSTAFTSSSILAVVSAMKAWSAECMAGAGVAGCDSSRSTLRAGGALESAPTSCSGECMLRAVLFLTIACLPFAAAAQSYRCVGTDGKKYYGQSVPPECLGQPIEQLNAQGLVVKKIDAQASADARAKMEAEEVERKKREAISKEEGRRDRALLATYTSEKDIEEARVRALAGNREQVTESEAKIAALKKRRALPGENTGSIDADLKAQQGLLAVNQKEADAVNTRYDVNKKNFT